ncbi:MAG TPA: hypothetical protein DCE41_06035 [Cytophagales bacterium]|nr:hypothetical protein [Cytophagales bacterium]HAP61068.1 hypothetical protein [Cytophagales bacterium]
MNTEILPHLHFGRLVDHDILDKAARKKAYVLSVMVPMPPAAALANDPKLKTTDNGKTYEVSFEVTEVLYTGVGIDSRVLMIEEDDLEGVERITVKLEFLGALQDKYTTTPNTIPKALAEPDITHVALGDEVITLIKPHVFLKVTASNPLSAAGTPLQYELRTLMPLSSGLAYDSISGPYHDVNTATTFVSILFKEDTSSGPQIVGKNLSWDTALPIEKVTVSGVQADPRVSGSTTTQTETPDIGG